jgi:hypothetical protein
LGRTLQTQQKSEVLRLHVTRENRIEALVHATYRLVRPRH